MDQPLEIAFHNTSRRRDAEEEIRRQFERLNARYPRILSCRVSVEALHKSHETGNLHEVHIVLGLPGEEIAVSREPHHAKERRAHPDVVDAVRDAFKTVERRMETRKGQMTDSHRVPSEQSIA